MKKLLNEELGRLDIASFKKAPKAPFIVVLDNIRSLNNVGSAFRTSDAFRVEGIYLCGITAKPPHREIQKTALGATESVKWKYFKTTIGALASLRAENYQIIAVEQADKSVKLQDFKIKSGNKYALIFGNEVKGVEEDVVEEADKVIEIPQFGTKHSLNVSVSIGVVLWDLWAKLRKTKI